jgi:N-methylhydantoinase A
MRDAIVGTHSIFVDGEKHDARLFDRTKLSTGDVIDGPAVIMEMDATTLILPAHHAEIDSTGNLLIRPDSPAQVTS